jgi:probable rRNA maturation factor
MQEAVVNFFYQDVQFAFTDRRKLKAFLSKLFHKEGKQLSELNIIFCTDEALLEINRSFLQHDYYTDIITLPLNAKGQPVVAELYISIDLLRKNCTE